jgi:predicted ATPase
MAASLTRFSIEGLHGLRTVDLPIEDNRLVLVGENGTGKSTVANLLYYLLTQQWRRFKDYRFSALAVTLSGEEFRLTHEDTEILMAHQSGPLGHIRRFPPGIVREAVDLLRFAGPTTKPQDVADQVSKELEIPLALARDLLKEIEETRVRLPDHLLRVVKALQSLNLGQFLYLPTYRRIEQDLKSIFRGIEIEEKIREFRDRFRKREKTFIELVEFGMEDVENTISSRMSQTKESVRTGLSNLTGTYLREVIRGLQGPADIEVLRSIEPSAFESILARIDDAILPAADKKLLQNKIAAIARGYSFGPDDKVIAHFLSKLVSLYREFQKNESDVREFVDLCNAYLTGKRFVYDDINYRIYIRQQIGSNDTEPGEQLELKMLSSGEKQIVSLFSHMYLSGEHNFFVVIDEPELSLSVPWQQRFLPDIIETGRCTGIIAVTHSPFIWENQLEPYVKSLPSFIQKAHVVR